jgi:hypothetical protein
MGFNSAFKGLMQFVFMQIYEYFSYFLSRLSAISPQKHAIYMYAVSVPLVWGKQIPRLFNLLCINASLLIFTVNF